MEDLKCFSDIIYGPIIAVHNSNNVAWRPPTPECENRVKGGVARVTWPRNFLGVKCYSSEMAKDTNFKFGRGIPRDSPDMTPDKSFRYVGVVRVCDPENFWVLTMYIFIHQNMVAITTRKQKRTLQRTIHYSE